MDYKHRPLYCRPCAWIVGIILVLKFSHIYATTNSVVLYNPITMSAGDRATYYCSTFGSGPDPSVAWKMTDITPTTGR
ncbi:hypothetical protein DPMN_120177 [Dreissena polymorpha]|uniref:Ig-like domain-containing protein n=1 Tax=Dreissena polymorpha TaxID=45954 RepID=A0A9D4GN56_DREPO|nr:hypothetical protein DPMN_120177 [Dreissena polymorpha]